MQNLFNLEKENFLEDLKVFIRATEKLTESAIRTYVYKIGQLIPGEYSVADLCGAIENILPQYGNGGAKFDPNDHGNTYNALKRVRAYVIHQLLASVRELHISYEYGWHSFSPKEEYVTGYTIDGGVITVSYSTRPVAEVKEIPADTLLSLIRLLKGAKAGKKFSDSNTAIRTEHGVINAYSYSCDGESGINCYPLFADDTLCAQYADLIKELL